MGKNEEDWQRERQKVYQAMQSWVNSADFIGRYSPNCLAEWLGYRNLDDLLLHGDNERSRHLIRMLGGAHGYAIYKALKVRRDET